MAKKLVMLLGVVFVLVGLLGFVNNPVLGLFAVDTLHNIVHLLSGVLALFFAAKGEDAAKSFAKVFGVVYALVALLGLLIPGESIFGLLTVNLADDMLHVVLALVFLWIGFGMGGSAAPASGGAASSPPPAAPPSDGGMGE
jgi:hypothetical protein